jgi:hypothetical protein
VAEKVVAVKVVAVKAVAVKVVAVTEREVIPSANLSSDYRHKNITAEGE